jgi:hypothetical protein
MEVKATLFLFLDDLRQPPDGAVCCRTAKEALRLLETGQVTHISFDHDLGTTLTGYDVAKRIEQWVMEGKIPLPSWEVHSANPVGRQNIEAAMRSAERWCNWD